MRAKKSSTLRKKVDPIDFSFDPLLFDSENFNHSAFLQKQGEDSLLQGDTKGLKYFDLAANLDQNNPQLFYEQGLCLTNYGREHKKKKYLLLANKKFKLATSLQPEFFLAWQAWGNTLFTLGNLFSETHFYEEAKKKLETASNLSSNSLLNYQLAQVFRKLAEKSGEVSDLQEALHHFKIATTTTEAISSELWLDYGSTCFTLGLQLNDSRLLLQSISFFKEGLRQNESFAPLWTELAKALSYLYELTHDEDHFCQANECFMNSVKLQSQNSDIWAAWALFLKNSGQRLHDIKRLRSSIEKCQRALLCSRKNISATIVWIESLAYLGLELEQLDLIYEASNKALEATEKFGSTPKLCKASGITLFALGKYYNDLDYYYQAIEKFQEGVSIDRTCHDLWYHLGHTYSVAAELESDMECYERAARFFAKAIHLHAKDSYYFEYACAVAKIGAQRQDQKTLEIAIVHFEQAFSLQNNPMSVETNFLYQYALALDLMGDLIGEESYYEKSIEILSKILLVEPDYPDIHFRIGVIYTHLGEMMQMQEPFFRAIQHYKLGYQHDEENENIFLEWGLALMNLAEFAEDEEEKRVVYEEAEFKLMQSAKLGNAPAYYHLACLFSLQNQFEKSFFFLKKAAMFDGMPPLDDVLEDLWLEGLRSTERFRTFLTHFERPEAEK